MPTSKPKVGDAVSIRTDKNELPKDALLRDLGFIKWRDNWFCWHGDDGLEWLGCRSWPRLLSPAEFIER